MKASSPPWSAPCSWRTGRIWSWAHQQTSSVFACSRPPYVGIADTSPRYDRHSARPPHLVIIVMHERWMNNSRLVYRRRHPRRPSSAWAWPRWCKPCWCHGYNDRWDRRIACCLLLFRLTTDSHIRNRSAFGKRSFTMIRPIEESNDQPII